MIVIFLYGLIIGSFLNVCIYRIPRGESIAFPPSHCSKCKYKIKWYDNIPIISYLIIKGKCRNCKESISIQYPLIEGLNGIMYLILYENFGFSIDFIFFALITSVLVVVTIIDLVDMLIPDVLIIIIFTLEIFHKLSLYFINDVSLNLLDSLLGILVSGGLFLLIVFVSRGGMGHGDVTLISSLGFILGLKLIILNIFLSFCIGALISIFLLITKIKNKKDPIPFGPFIIISFFIVLFYGTNILYWYFSFYKYGS